MAKRVAIIGAGASGLAAIKCCLDEALDPVCFEGESDIGGLWNYSDETKEGKATVYKSCVINTSKEMFAYSSFPVPKDFPPFMSHSYVLKYLRLYAEEFELLRHIRFNTVVDYVRKSSSYSVTGRWVVGYSSDQSEEFDAVMICSGHHVHPNLPDIKGMEEFKGQQVHSHDYRIPEPYTDKTVVVVGIGNSAVDIAVDLSRVASQVYLSTRRGAWIVSRVGPYGIPMDVLANSRCAFTLPRTWLQRMVEIMANQKFDHEALGLSPNHRVLESHPTINDELPLRILTGSIKVMPDIKSLAGHSVNFTDGAQRHVDAVIYATGYDYQCPFIDNDVINLTDNKVDLYKFMFPPNLRHGTLAMIGLVQPVGAFPPVSEMQSRWFTRIQTGNIKLPDLSVMKQEVTQKRKKYRLTYYRSMKHTCETFWIQYMDEIAEQFGAKPNFYSLFLSDPCLAARCFFGPCIPAQYRLQGPGSWSGAKDAIRRAFTNNTEATRTRRGDSKTKNTDKSMFWDFLFILFVIGFLMCIYDTGLFLKIW